MKVNESEHCKIQLWTTLRLVLALASTDLFFLIHTEAKLMVCWPYKMIPLHAITNLIVALKGANYSITDADACMTDTLPASVELI